jgi:PAS domain-containing protein
MSTSATTPQPCRHADATWWNRSEDLLCVLGGDLVVRAANPAWGRVLGRPPREFVGAHVLECVHPDDARRLLGQLPARADRFIDLECRLRDERGRWRWTLWSGVRRGKNWECSGKDVTAFRERAIAFGEKYAERPMVRTAGGAHPETRE